MYVLRKDNDIVASTSTNYGDVMEAEFSMFRGPNHLTWYNYSPDADVMMFSSDMRTYTLDVYNGKGSITLSMNLRIECVYFDQEKGCNVVRLIPNAHYLAQTYIESYQPAAKKFSTVLKEIFPNLIKIKIASDVDKEFYNGFYFKGLIIDAIAKFCEDHNVEFMLTDEKVYIGGIQDNDINDQMFFYENTLASYSNKLKRFISGTSKTAMPLPGYLVKMYDGVYRIIYFHMRSTKGYSDFTVHCTERDQKITEVDLAYCINYFSKMRMMQDIRSNQSGYGTFVAQTTADTEMFTKKMMTYTESRDMNKIEFQQSSDMRVVKATPYAGEHVGISFPSNPTAVGICVSHEGERSCAVEVGQLYQEDKMPKKNSVNDFRFTLPDGGSLYYNDASGEWILAAKSKITIGTQSNISDTSVPTGNNKTITIDGSNVVITDGTRTITLGNNVVNVT